MRDNGPVTHREHHLPAGENLVSTTDLKGRILYCNPAFVAASGYERHELEGQAHNLVRHPDMPAEAFRDLWETIAAGEPWSMLVKNRRKNGDHYWVRASVTPLVNGTEVIGYMSVRTVPERADVEAAEALYAHMSREQASGRPAPYTLHHGQLTRSGVAGRWQKLSRTLWSHRLALLPATFGAAACAATVLLGSSVALALAIPLGGVVYAVQRRALNAPLAGLMRFAQRMAAGDLTQRITVTDSGFAGRLQQALNQLNVNLQTVIGDARGEIEQIEIGVAEIAAGNRDLSGRTESQASGLQQTAASTEEITGTVRANAAAARDGSHLAQEAVAVTQRSRATVDKVRTSMHSISESSRRIADITQVIDGISFQTNILALNAAVEAARAGEHGRGFAVVASEVRSLAQRTSQAAREIKTLIGHSQERIDAGVTEVETAAGAMGETTHSVNRMHELVSGIHRASDEQLKAICQVNEAVASMDGITQQNAAMVEQLAATATALSTRAKVMKDSVQVFRTQERAIALPNAVALRKQARQRQAA